MTRFIRFLKAAWLIANSPQQWADGLEWMPDDRLALRKYMLSAEGARFAAMMRNNSLTINAVAVQSGDAHRCGIATGYMRALNDIQILSAEVEPEDDQNTEAGSETGAASLDHMNP